MLCLMVQPISVSSKFVSKLIKMDEKAACRRVISLDGCFLKGVCKCELLYIMGRDANNKIYPIAWVVLNVAKKVNGTVS